MNHPHPNILLVLADQHQANMLGCAGHPQVLTPYLDAFAATAVRFTNAYCPNTICTPSRVSILSGQYCHNHGIYGLSGPAPLGLDNLMRRCRAAGYRTAGLGKLHLPDAPRNWLADDLDYFGDSYETAEGERGKSDFLAELERLGLRQYEDSWHNEFGVYGKGTISQDARPSLLPYEHTQEYWCVRRALEFIDEAPGRPFCVHIAFQRPHHPLLPNQRFWDLYPEDLDLPPTVHQPPDLRPSHFRQMWQHFHTMTWEYAQPGEPWEAGARRAWRGTLACVSQVDDVFGTLLRGLEERGLAENTIVIYSSDHGGYHGVHGIVEKAPGICSDAICRVPLLWRVPGVTPPGALCEELVETVDLTPTLLSLCGLEPSESADGLDLTPLLRGERAPLHTVAVTENPWSKSIRWGPWRLVHYQREMFGGQDVGELYQIEQDPNETRNLYYDPAYAQVVNEGRRLLLEWLITTTRIVTSHPALEQGPRLTGKRTYPLCGDGRAPNALQPRFRKDNHINYL